MKRCCNIDWLEVFCYEPATSPRDELYFVRAGYEVKSRNYGTPQYRSMFTVYQQGTPLLEIRRDPRSLRRDGGIFEVGACSLRLVNQSCYMIAPIDFLRKFIIAHGFTYRSITRIDICLDFNRFDNGKNPQDFITLYMQGKVAKLNQCNLAAHGSDSWAKRNWNSLKWGSPSSNVTTKIYNKTKEMQQVGAKFYIMDAWKDAGLDMAHDVWRIEFSINSQAQSLANKKTGEIVKKSLLDYDTPQRLLIQWSVLASHYFHFKSIIRGERGGYKRKDRCPDFATIVIRDPQAECFMPIRNPTQDKKPTRTLKILLNVLENIAANDKEETKIRYAAIELFATLTQRCRMYEEQQRAESMRAAIGFFDNQEASPKRMTEEQLAQYRQDFAEKEIALMRSLMRKYGETGRPKDCPF